MGRGRSGGETIISAPSLSRSLSLSLPLSRLLSRLRSLSFYSRSLARARALSVCRSNLLTASSILETDSMSMSTRFASVMRARAAVRSLILLLRMRAQLEFPSHSLSDASRQHPPSAATQRSKNSLRNSQTCSRLRRVGVAVSLALPVPACSGLDRMNTSINACLF